MLALMAELPDPDNQMSYLTSINVVGAELRVTDEVMNQTWNSPSSDITISRSENGLIGVASLITDVDGRQTEIELEGQYRRADHHMEILVNFTDISATAMVFSGSTPGKLEKDCCPCSIISTFNLVTGRNEPRIVRMFFL